MKVTQWHSHRLIWCFPMRGMLYPNGVGCYCFIYSEGNARARYLDKADAVPTPFLCFTPNGGDREAKKDLMSMSLFGNNQRTWCLILILWGLCLCEKPLASTPPITVTIEKGKDLKNYLANDKLQQIETLTIIGDLDRSDLTLLSRMAGGTGLEGALSVLDLSDANINVTGYSLLSGDKLTSVTLPKSLSNFSYAAFDCPNLKEINIPEENQSYASIDGVVFFKDMTTLFLCPEGKTGNFKIPSTVTKIGTSAFMDSQLSNIEMPNSVQEIGTFAFSTCSNMTSITLSNSLKKIESGVFHNCRNLSHVYIPNSVTEIGSGAFAHCGFEAIDLPTSITSIDESAFNGCENLKSIKLPEGITVK